MIRDVIDTSLHQAKLCYNTTCAFKVCVLMLVKAYGCVRVWVSKRKKRKDTQSEV